MLVLLFIVLLIASVSVPIYNNQRAIKNCGYSFIRQGVFMKNKVSKKAVIITAVVLLLALLAVGSGLLICRHKTIEKKFEAVKSQEITLSADELELFRSFLGFEKPECLHILNCEYSTEEDAFFAVRAVISDSEIHTLTRAIEDTPDVQICNVMSAHRSVSDEFAEARNVSWWIPWESPGRIVLFDDILFDNQNKADALLIMKIDQVNYVYLWRSLPDTVCH